MEAVLIGLVLVIWWIPAVYGLVTGVSYLFDFDPDSDGSKGFVFGLTLGLMIASGLVYYYREGQ